MKQTPKQVQDIVTSFNNSQRCILVGTYKKKPDQLKWINLHHIYNYPLSEEEAKSSNEGWANVKELWLYSGSKEHQYAYDAEFITIKSREDFLKENSDYPKGKGNKPHGEYYAIFNVHFKYQPIINDSIVAVRIGDFTRRTPKIAQAIRAYQSGDGLGSLLDYLPSTLAPLTHNQLFVCEKVVQLSFLDILMPGINMHCSAPPIVQNQKLPIIDLFAGCGGMSLGFELAGFHSILAIEKDAWASETYAYNRPGVNVITADITKILHPKEEYSQIDDVFGIIGGPPCQGFSLSGDRDPKDPRNSLFMDYMRFVKDFKPPFFVMENVPGILSSVTQKGESVKNVIITIANELGYNVKIMQLDASHYGVPQSRQRVFFIGIRNDYPFDPERLIPEKTTADHPITIRQAISDLPKIKACEGTEEMPYETAPDNEYQKWCRAGSDVVHNHVAMRHTPRLVARFHVIKYGESIADVPQEHMQRKRGNATMVSGKVYSQNNMRPFPDRPSPTVPASFQSNFVHPFSDRNYTAREGARLQSFPDRYVFCGRRTTMSWEKNLSQYQQIGNAVPPLLAKALGEMIKRYFIDIENIKDKS